MNWRDEPRHMPRYRCRDCAHFPAGQQQSYCRVKAALTSATNRYCVEGRRREEAR